MLSFTRRRPARHALTAFRSYATPPTPTSLDTVLRTALKSSMKARDSFRSGVLKSALADLQTASHTPSPPSPSKTLSRSISVRLDAATTFDSSNPPRADIAEQYRKEAEILAEFVEPEPEGMELEKLDAAVESVLLDLGLVTVGPKDTGRIIKAVMEKVQGQASGKEISDAVKRVRKQD